MLLVGFVAVSCNKDRYKKSRATSCIGGYTGYDSKVDLCTDTLCEKYLNIWKEIFIQRNGLTEQYFNDHIKIIQTRMDDWWKGTSFDVEYMITIDWAVAHEYDDFIIKINADSISDPSFSSVPRGVLLSKEDIEKIVEAKAWSSEIHKLTSDETFKFYSAYDAIGFLIKQADVTTLCLNGFYIDGTTGHMVLSASATYVNEWNKCINATLDLINGKATFYDSPCWIN